MVLMLFQEFAIYAQSPYRCEMNTVKVKDEPGLVRDTETNAVLSTDLKGLQAYKAQKRRMQKVDELSDNVEELNKKMLNIEKLLTKLVERDNK